MYNKGKFVSLTYIIKSFSTILDIVRHEYIFSKSQGGILWKGCPPWVYTSL
jgi:hypothetical protein